MSPVLRGIYRRFVRVASAYHKERAGALLLATVRSEFRAAAPSGPPLSGADLAAAEATAARTFEFVRRAVFHGGTERALLRQLVHHADDWARGEMRPGSMKLRAQRATFAPAARRAWEARVEELNADLGIALKRV